MSNSELSICRSTFLIVFIQQIEKCSYSSCTKVKFAFVDLVKCILRRMVNIKVSLVIRFKTYAGNTRFFKSYKIGPTAPFFNISNEIWRKKIFPFRYFIV
jgi:hypothetical protein